MTTLRTWGTVLMDGQFYVVMLGRIEPAVELYAIVDGLRSNAPLCWGSKAFGEAIDAGHIQIVSRDANAAWLLS